MKAKQTPKSAFEALRSSGGTTGRKRPRPAGRDNEPDPPAATLRRQPLSAPEIQSLVNSMRSVLGESAIDETTARMHLFHCNYNLEAAINRHFNHAHTHGEQSHRKGRSPKLGVSSGRTLVTAAASAPKRPVKNAFALLREKCKGEQGVARKVTEGATVKMSVHAAENVKQYTLGWGLVQGQSTTTGKGIVHAEQEIFIWRESSSSNFIRFGVQQGIALGKLSRDVTAFLAPLMDAGGIRCSAKVQSYRKNLRSTILCSSSCASECQFQAYFQSRYSASLRRFGKHALRWQDGSSRRCMQRHWLMGTNRTPMLSAARVRKGGKWALC